MPDPVLRKYYVYVLYRAYGDRLPCYVGKGTGSRMKYHERLGASHYNKHLAAIFAKCGGSLPHAVVFHTDDEKAAFDEERRLIALYGRAVTQSGCLCNLTDGGDGHSGYVQSPELRAWRSNDMRGNQYGIGNTNKRGKKASDETREKLRRNTNAAGNQNRKGMQNSNAWCVAVSQRMIDNTHTRGFKHSAESIARRAVTRAANKKIQEAQDA